MYFAARAVTRPPGAQPPPDPSRMLLYILSRGHHLYSTERLAEAARRQGLKVQILDPTRINVVLAEASVTFSLGGQPLRCPDLVIGRFSPVYTRLGAALLAQFASAGAKVSPGAVGLLTARDKWLAQTTMRASQIPMPPAAMVHDLSEVDDIVAALGGHPVIIKLLESTQGAGVMISRDPQTTLSILQSFESLHQGVLVQEYIPETGGADVRIIVCGTEVVAAMERTPAAGEFRSNLHRGATALATELSAVERATALAAVAAIGLDVAGVDVLRAGRGPLVMEVNASPGLEGIEGATGVDVAGAIIRYLSADR